jgi:gas vesicle protein
MHINRKLDDLRNKTNDEMAAELRHYEKEKATDKLVKELLKQREHIREEVREAVQSAKLEQVEEEFKEFHRRRAEQLAEMEVRTYFTIEFSD